jgi:hypothetical protein
MHRPAAPCNTPRSINATQQDAAGSRHTLCVQAWQGPHVETPSTRNSASVSRGPSRCACASPASGSRAGAPARRSTAPASRAGPVRLATPSISCADNVCRKVYRWRKAPTVRGLAHEACWALREQVHQPGRRRRRVPGRQLRVQRLHERVCGRGLQAVRLLRRLHACELCRMFLRKAGNGASMCWCQHLHVYIAGMACAKCCF